MEPPSPFHSALSTPLLSFGGETWTIDDATQATAIWGAPGSGKTSGSGRMIARAFLSAGMGGLVLCAKTDEAETWKRYAKEAGREADLIVVDDTAAHRFNILDFAAKHLAGRGFEHNLVELVNRMGEAASVADTKGQGSGENRYFIDNALKWVGHAFPLLMLAYETLRMRDLNSFISSAPQSPAEAADISTKSADALSFCLKTHILAGERALAYRREADAAGPHTPESAELRARADHAMRLIDEHGDFFLDEFPRLDNRPRSGVESTLTNLIYPFLSGKLADLFCTTTTVTPSMCRDGKIIIMDIPTLRYGAAGAVSQTLFKYLFGLQAQSSPTLESTRPIFLYADEAQFFINSADADLLSTARSSKTCVVFITQDLPTYYAKLGANARDVADSMLSKFGTRIFHANTSRETNQAAAEIIGKVRKYHVTRSISRGSSTGGGGNLHDGGGGFHAQGGDSTNRTESTSVTMEYELAPDFFATKLRAGGSRNDFKVDGVVVRNARTWKATKRHWLKAEFNQQ